MTVIIKQKECIAIGIHNDCFVARAENIYIIILQYIRLNHINIGHCRRKIILE